MEQEKKLFALVDRGGNVIADAGTTGAPWEGLNPADALREAEDTLGRLPVGCRAVPMTRELAYNYSMLDQETTPRKLVHVGPCGEDRWQGVINPVFCLKTQRVTVKRAGLATINDAKNALEERVDIMLAQQLRSIPAAHNQTSGAAAMVAATNKRAQWIEMSKIVPNRFEPPVRLTSSALQKLRADLLVTRERGGFTPAITVKRETGAGVYHNINGHRRLAILEDIGGDLGDGTVFCDIVGEYDADLELRDFLDNNEHRHLSAAECSQMWALSEDRKSVLCEFSKAQQKNIKNMVSVFGPDRAAEICASGTQSPTVAGVIMRVRSCFVADSSRKKGGIPSLKQIGEWALRHSAQRYLDQLRRDALSGRTVNWGGVIRKINNNKPW